MGYPKWDHNFEHHPSRPEICAQELAEWTWSLRLQASIQGIQDLGVKAFRV